MPEAGQVPELGQQARPWGGVAPASSATRDATKVRSLTENQRSFRQGVMPRYSRSKREGSLHFRWASTRLQRAPRALADLTRPGDGARHGAAPPGGWGTQPDPSSPSGPHRWAWERRPVGWQERRETWSHCREVEGGANTGGIGISTSVLFPAPSPGWGMRHESGGSKRSQPPAGPHEHPDSLQGPSSSTQGARLPERSSTLEKAS